MKHIFALFFVVLSGSILSQEPVTNNSTYTGDDDKNSIVNLIVEEFREDPIRFKKEHLDDYIHKLSNKEIDQLIPKLYEGLSGIKEKSEASEKIMGRLNKRYNKGHKKYFEKRIHRTGRTNYRMVLIEGDSWFNFPTPLKSDLTKILEHKPDLLVHSSAFGGDWISRMIKDQSYLEEIIRLSPDAFILSGGGNDIVGERLSSFVDVPARNKTVNVKFKIAERDNKINKPNDASDLTYLFTYGKEPDMEVVYGTRFLNLNFFEMLVELELQYKIIHQQINNQEKKNDGSINGMKLITQGYDFPVPRFNKAPFWCNPWRSILNRFLGSGKWLYMPLKIKGIDDPEDQRKVMKAMMYYFNEMLVDIAGKKVNGEYVYPFAYHIDNRGLMDKLGGNERARYWFDELHPKRLPYDIIANTMREVINGTHAQLPNKVINTSRTVVMDKKRSRIANRKNHCGCYKTD